MFFTDRGSSPERGAQGGRGEPMTKTAMRTLVLVKADPTEWDRAGRLQGSTDLPAVAGNDNPHPAVGPIDLILSGPDEASRAQAEAWASRTGAKAAVEEDLRELDLGLWTGLRADELEARFERAGGQWLEDPACVAPPEGETVASLVERAMPVLQKWVGKRRGPKRIAVILRPLAYGALRCRLEGRGTTCCRGWMESSVEPVSFDVTAHDPRLSAEMPVETTGNEAHATTDRSSLQTIHEANSKAGGDTPRPPRRARETSSVA